MTIVLHLPPETERRLGEEAKNAGTRPETWASRLVEWYLTMSEEAQASGTRSRIQQIAVDHAYRGLSPEQIQAAYPHLTLTDIYQALAYYYRHREEMDQTIKAGAEEEERLRRAADESPFVKRMRAEGRLG